MSNQKLKLLFFDNFIHLRLGSGLSLRSGETIEVLCPGDRHLSQEVNAETTSATIEKGPAKDSYPAVRESERSIWRTDSGYGRHREIASKGVLHRP